MDSRMTVAWSTRCQRAGRTRRAAAVGWQTRAMSCDPTIMDGIMDFVNLVRGCQGAPVPAGRPFRGTTADDGLPEFRAHAESPLSHAVEVAA